MTVFLDMYDYKNNAIVGIFVLASNQFYNFADSLITIVISKRHMWITKTVFVKEYLLSLAKKLTYLLTPGETVKYTDKTRPRNVYLDIETYAQEHSKGLKQIPYCICLIIEAEQEGYSD